MKQVLFDKMQKLFVITVALLLTITTVKSNRILISQAEETDEPVRNVLDFNTVSVHDPSIIKVDDTYYVFGSHVSAAKSMDLKNWESIVGTDVSNNELLGNIKVNFSEAFEWAGNGDVTDIGALGIWAPDVYYSDTYENEDGSKGAYLMYFSLSTGQDEPGVEHYRSLIGLAVSKNVEGPYVYQDTVVYSGFTNNEADKGHWSHTDFNEVYADTTPRSGYFHSNGAYNFNLFPNAIDPTIVDGHDGKLYMTYGSWNGGIWILEIDPTTGLAKRQENYNGGNTGAERHADAYFGTKIALGERTTGEGPYIQYHEETGYYHLYITYGTLDAAGTYNMRFFRSKNIMGPYVDQNGVDPFVVDRNNRPDVSGKILGSFEFLKDQTIVADGDAFGYRVPGHNSVYYDEDTGENFVIFHTRFKDRGEGHEVRVHQIFFDDAGWPLIAPQRYHGETIQNGIDVTGNYLVINQGKETHANSKTSVGITLNADGSIVGAYTGSWTFADKLLTLTLGDETFKGYVLDQATPLTNWVKDLTLTLNNGKGISLIGARVGDFSVDDLLDAAKNNLSIGKTVNVVSNLTLPTQSVGGVQVAWVSNDPAVISNTGVVTRQEDVAHVTLTATLSYAGRSVTKTFEIKTARLVELDHYALDFNGSLTDSFTREAGRLTGDRFSLIGSGNENYRDGYVVDETGSLGEAFYFDGQTGIRLPENLITGNTYTISMWINPEEVLPYTTLFFGDDYAGSWQSIILSHGGNPRSFLWSTQPVDQYHDAYLADGILPTHTWTHLAITVDDGLIRTYVNGVKYHESDNYFDIYGDAVNSGIALAVNHWDVPYKGLMDDLKVYPSDALNPEDIASYYEEVNLLRSTEDMANAIFDGIIFGDVVDNLELPNKGSYGAILEWESDDTAIIKNNGQVTRPSKGNPDAVVKLTATLTLRGETFTRDYDVTVKAIPQPAAYYKYAFEGNIKEGSDAYFDAKLSGVTLLSEGGLENYGEGVVGEAFYFDGETSLRLPDDMIVGNAYTISYWMKPETKTTFTSAFFGIQGDRWLSAMPSRWDDAHLIWVARGEDRWFIDSFESLNLDAWIYVTITVDDNVATLYHNGNVVAQITDMPHLFDGLETGTFGLGANIFPDPAFKGYMDEFIVYGQEAKDAASIQAYYQDVMGIKTPEEIAKMILNGINLPSETLENLSLVKDVDGYAIGWHSSNNHVISTEGIVTRPNPGTPDVSVRLVASVEVEGIVFEKEFVVKVRALPSLEDRVYYNFENTLVPVDKPTLAGKVIGDKIGVSGGSLKYAEGISGQGVYLDGTTGIQLPDDLIVGETYSVSLWMHADQLTNFTPIFFGGNSDVRWVSVIPRGHEPHTSAMVWGGSTPYYDGISNQVIKPGAWNHIAFTVDKGNVKLYIDGVLKFTGTNFPNPFNDGGKNIFTLGVNWWDTPFKGTLDELIIMPNQVMGSTDILEHYEGIVSQLTPEAIANQFFGSLVLGENGVVTQDLTLPKSGPNGATVSYISSNLKYLSNTGKVTRPLAAQGDMDVKLTVSIVIEGQIFKKTFDLTIKAESMTVDSVYYEFNKNLKEASGIDALEGKTTQGLINIFGGKAQYREGKVDQGIYLDGTYGVRLPDGLIKGNTYSVSMWVKPDALTDFSTTFFGAQNTESWISFTPLGVGGQSALWSGTAWYDGLTNYVMAPNMWTHVAFTVNNGQVRVYINGEVKHTGSTFPLIFSKDIDGVFGLGVNWWDTPFKGMIDELKVETKRVMSAKEIYDYYDATVGADRFVRNVNKSLKLSFENTTGPTQVTGNRLDNFVGRITYEEGVVGQAAYFDGNSGLRFQDGFLTSNKYSLQMWVKPESITAYSTTFFGGSAASSWVSMPLSGVNGKTMFWSGENWYDALSTKTIPANRWSHLAVSVNAGSIQVYIDGELEFSGTGFPDVFTSPNTFAGLGVNFWDIPFKGLIDEFELHNNITLSGDAIKRYYEETAPDQEAFERNQEKTHIFKFEDSLVDEMNAELEGTIVGGLISETGGNIDFVNGVEGKAAYFDGASGILLPKELITSENYSVSLWVNPETISTHTTTFFGAQTEASWVSVVVESGDFTSGNSMVWSGTDWYDGNLGTQIPADTWSHIAFTVEAGVLNAYLDGERVFTGEGFPDVFVMEDSTFALGVNWWDTAFNGLMDEVMVFDSRVLSAEEVRAISEGNFDLDADTDVDEDIDALPTDVDKSNMMVPLIVGGTISIAAVAAAVYYFVLRRRKA